MTCDECGHAWDPRAELSAAPGGLACPACRARAGAAGRRRNLACGILVLLVLVSVIIVTLFAAVLKMAAIIKYLLS